jgi:acetyltransferase-like isoleucine patch superfamily enzyme
LDVKFLSVARDVKLGESVLLASFINLCGCTIGDNSKIGAFVEIRENVTVGRNCQVSSHVFVCEGVTIEDEVFLGHGVIFANDALEGTDALQAEGWKVEPTVVKRGASIGSGAVIYANITIGENAIVGAGAVVASDVPPNGVVAANPARLLRFVGQKEGRVIS